MNPIRRQFFFWVISFQSLAPPNKKHNFCFVNIGKPLNHVSKGPRSHAYVWWVSRHGMAWLSGLLIANSGAITLRAFVPPCRSGCSRCWCRGGGRSSSWAWHRSTTLFPRNIFLDVRKREAGKIDMRERERSPSVANCEPGRATLPTPCFGSFLQQPCPSIMELHRISTLRCATWTWNGSAWIDC